MCTAFQQIRDEGIKIGEVRGEARGEKRGEARVNKLIQRLISDSRSSDIERAVTDPGYQKKLFKYYGI